MVKEEITSEIEWKRGKLTRVPSFLSSLPSLELRVHVFRHHLLVLFVLFKCSVALNHLEKERPNLLLSPFSWKRERISEKTENEKYDREAHTVFIAWVTRKSTKSGAAKLVTSEWTEAVNFTRKIIAVIVVINSLFFDFATFFLTSPFFFSYRTVVLVSVGPTDRDHQDQRDHHA